MDSILALISMVTGIAVGGLALVASRQQPAQASRLRGISVLFFGVAGVMAVLFFI